MDKFIAEGIAEVKVLETSGSWFGVTYPEDKPIVVASIKACRCRGISRAAVGLIFNESSADASRAQPQCRPSMTLG